MNQLDINNLKIINNQDLPEGNRAGKNHIFLQTAAKKIPPGKAAIINPKELDAKANNLRNVLGKVLAKEQKKGNLKNFTIRQANGLIYIINNAWSSDKEEKE